MDTTLRSAAGGVDLSGRSALVTGGASGIGLALAERLSTAGAKAKVVDLDGGPHGVTSNCINPGYVRTPLVEKQIADQARAHGIPEDKVLEQVMLTRSAVKRLAEPREVAELAVYLCSADASYINGA